MRKPASWRAALSLLLLTVCAGAVSRAQDASEALGPKDNAAANATVPLESEMRTLHASLLPRYAGVHPRVYFDNADLKALRVRAHGSEAALWTDVTAHLRVFRGDPPPPPAEQRRAQNDVAFAIAEGAFAYSIDHDPRVLAATKKYMDAAVSYDIWGYAFSKPNVDLAAGHLLYGMGLAYDLLYHDLSDEERSRYRACLARHGHLLYQYFAPRKGRSWSYSQNHTFIPIAGLAVAAYAVMGELPEAAQWAQLSRAIYSRVLATYSKDGYYYEGVEYWTFSTPWIIHYLDAHKHATGEDLYNQPGLKQTHLYLLHSMLPGAQSMFDFGDVFEGPLTRAKQGDDYERSHPAGHYESNYTLLYRLAAQYRDPQIQTVAEWLRGQGHTAQEEWWTLAWRDRGIVAKPITTVPAYHHFRDHDVAYWRSDWTAGATAIAFKCGPPEGHAITEIARGMPDFHMEAGHAHPDVNSFILFAHGRYLTGDSGYAGVPKTIEHNTLLVDGRGQGNEGKGHDAWAGFPYDRLNGARITRADLSSKGFTLVGEGASAYPEALGLTRFQRTVTLAAPGEVRIQDSIASGTPHQYTEVLHTDTAWQQAADGSLRTAGLRVDAPPGAAITLEKNVVMGPGKPGSVDKGTPEQRGERATATLPGKTGEATFTWTLHF